MALADAEGLEAVTIRRLAQDLGVTPMALYWHFRNKDLLMAALADQVIAEVDLTVDESAPWIDQFRTLIEALVRVLRAHPWVVSVFSPRTCESERYFSALEVMLGILRDAGFTPEEAAEISRHAIRVAISLVGGQPGIAGPHDADELEEMQRRSRLAFETLSRKRYPRIVEAAGPLSACDDLDSYYDFGVDLLIRGVHAKSLR
jgi:AcrR family transcriptional regulator